MRHSTHFLVLVLFIVCLPEASSAMAFDLAAWYGGSTFSSKATIESESKTGSVGGSHLVGSIWRDQGLPGRFAPWCRMNTTGVEKVLTP